MNQLKQAAWLFLLALIYSVTPSQPAGTDENKNAAELNTLCELINLAHGDATELNDASIDTADRDVIEALNLSLADHEWSEQFSDDASKPNDDPVPCKDKPASDPCKLQWKRWEAVRAKAKQDSTWPEKLSISSDKLTSAPVRAAAFQLAGIAAQAVQLKTHWETQYKPAVKGLTEAILGMLNTAAYGKETLPAADSERCDFAISTSRKAMCELPNACKALCIATICICAKGSSQNKDICGDTVTPNANAWSSGNFKAHYTTYNTLCKKAEKIKITASAIETRLAALKAMYKNVGHANGRSLVLGTATSDNTCKDEDDAACIDLTKATVITGAGIADIEWEQNLVAEASKIIKAEKAKAQKVITDGQIKAMRRQPEAIFKQVAFAPAKLTKESTNTPTQTKNKQATEEAAKCEKFDNNATVCTNNDCSYYKSKNKCKPKPGSETPATGTGEVTKTKKCKGKLEPECTKAPGCK
uniref:Variant surface glycoprotein 1125.1141 n=1 Tax=Trypanosoma brucei TaxID=5691 RepID=A0A1J0R6B9_9TRYP|nr:variant surface glycoprotein 1125.1141 [Trypanosoma brucei]